MASYYQRITVLLNARAGNQNATPVQLVADAFRAAGADVDVRPTEGASIAGEAAAAVTRGSKVVVVAGGDGTVSAAAAALAGSDAALGILPLGTLNHFAKDLGIPQDLGEAARVIAAGRATSVDMGEVNGRLFINNASVGMYARLISERTAMQRIGRRKWLAHALAAVRVWRRYRRLRVEIRTGKGEGGRGKGRVRTPFVFVGNNEYQLSGLELGRRETLDGGRFHVCMAPGMSRGGVVRMIIAAVFGDVSTIEGFESFTAPSVTLDADVGRLEASIDGEAVMLDNPLTFHIRPRVLKVIVP
ncbi:MAG TPA: diacylglycerol kinase family protein [Vicinamibacterales bacterium]|jgi:diacylglycerol kinase family enzyme